MLIVGDDCDGLAVVLDDDAGLRVAPRRLEANAVADLEAQQASGGAYEPLDAAQLVELNRRIPKSASSAMKKRALQTAGS